MKRALFAATFIIHVLFAFGVHTTAESQTFERMFTELRFAANSWTLEMHPPRVHVLNGWYLQTHNGRAYFKSGIRIDTGFVVVTSDSLLAPLMINPLGDTLSISDGQMTRQSLTFGGVAGAVVAAPRLGQSLCYAPNNSGYYWYLDNTPTLGRENDFLNAIGLLHGTVRDSSGSPIRNTRVYFGDWPQLSVLSDSNGRFTISDCARVESMLLVHRDYPALSCSLQLWPESTLTMSFTLQEGSLEDVFPLAIGNQWSYDYFYDWEDDPWINPNWSWRDSGFVNLNIFSRVGSSDSTRWRVQQTGLHWTSYNFSPWAGPTSRTDTFEIIEFAAGNHGMYRTGTLYDIRRSVLPFVPDLVDTARIFRYAVVDMLGNKRLRSREDPMGVFFDFNFVRSIGLTSVFMTNGITGWPYYWTDHSLRSSIIVSVDEPKDELTVEGFRLMQNYPNPFNPNTRIGFRVSGSGFVSLKVYDVLGREVATLVNEKKTSGEYQATWDGCNNAGVRVSSGIYFYRLEVKPVASATSSRTERSLIATRKLILLN